MISASELISKGYFPEVIIPPFTSKGLPKIMTPFRSINRSKLEKSSKCCQHSVPRPKNHRRFFSIPNPLHQVILCLEIEKKWSEIEAHFTKSKISLTIPQLTPDSIRTIDRSNATKQQKIEEILRSTNSRFVLNCDISRFYPSIYTHSIVWALHGKAYSKDKENLRDNTILGNILDSCVRNTQDKQTMGIPIGPDTSHIIAEIIGVTIDCKLQKKIPNLKGYRYIDDFTLFFRDWAEAEQAQNDLEFLFKYYELQPNIDKTKILDLPQPIDPEWISELRLYNFRQKANEQRTDIINYFSKAFQFTKKFPYQNVMKYAIKRMRDENIFQDNWEIFESLLLKSIMAEATCLPPVINILDRYNSEPHEYPLNQNNRIEDAINEIILQHSVFSHGYELSWALWLLKTLNLQLKSDAVEKLAHCDDCIVALISLDLENQGLFESDLDKSFWEQYMKSDELYEDHWLLTYEGLKKGWLENQDHDNYLEEDLFFSILNEEGIEFYDTIKTEKDIPPEPVRVSY
jgi:hypothetical protein